MTILQIMICYDDVTNVIFKCQIFHNGWVNKVTAVNSNSVVILSLKRFGDGCNRTYAIRQEGSHGRSNCSCDVSDMYRVTSFIAHASWWFTDIDVFVIKFIVITKFTLEIKPYLWYDCDGLNWLERLSTKGFPSLLAPDILRPWSWKLSHTVLLIYINIFQV